MAHYLVREAETSVSRPTLKYLSKSSRSNACICETIRHDVCMQVIEGKCCRAVLVVWLRCTQLHSEVLVGLHCRCSLWLVTISPMRNSDSVQYLPEGMPF